MDISTRAKRSLKLGTSERSPVSSPRPGQSSLPQSFLPEALATSVFSLLGSNPPSSSCLSKPHQTMDKSVSPTSRRAQNSPPVTTSTAAPLSKLSLAWFLGQPSSQSGFLPLPAVAWSRSTQGPCRTPKSCPGDVILTPGPFLSLHPHCRHWPCCSCSSRSLCSGTCTVFLPPDAAPPALCRAGPSLPVHLCSQVSILRPSLSPSLAYVFSFASVCICPIASLVYSH